jgi:hypothetical protein
MTDRASEIKRILRDGLHSYFLYEAGYRIDDDVNWDRIDQYLGGFDTALSTLAAEGERMTAVVDTLVAQEDLSEAYIALRDGGDEARYRTEGQAVHVRLLDAMEAHQDALWSFRQARTSAPPAATSEEGTSE